MYGVFFLKWSREYEIFGAVLYRAKKEKKERKRRFWIKTEYGTVPAPVPDPEHVYWELEFQFWEITHLLSCIVLYCIVLYFLYCTFCTVLNTTFEIYAQTQTQTQTQTKHGTHKADREKNDIKGTQGHESRKG